MATNTPNINLEKPIGTEKYDLAVVNGNSDIIDAEITDAKTGSNLRAFKVKNDLTLQDNAVSRLSGDGRYPQKTDVFTKVEANVITDAIEVKVDDNTALINSKPNINKLINGGFDIWQRGTSFAGNTTYTADRWGRDVRDPLVNRVDSGIPEIGGYALQQSGGTQQRIITQGIELFKTGGAGEFQIGKTYTLSFYFKNSNATDLTTSLSFADGVAVGTNQSLIATKAHDIANNGWSKYTHTFTIAINPNPSNICLKLEFTTLDTTATTTIAQVQLEEGAIATAFESRPIGLEELLCKRYYEVLDSTISAPGIGSATVAVHWIYNVEKRIFPTFVDSGGVYTSIGVNTRFAQAQQTNGTAVIGAGSSVDAEL